MAEAALSKSLDDLIKEQRQKKDKQKPQKHKAKANPKIISPKSGGSGQKRGNKRGNSMGKRLPAPHNITVTVQGAVTKSTGRPAPRPRDPEITNPELRAQRLDGPAKWKHDMYTQLEGNRPRGPRAPSHLGTKLFVSNLDYKVSDADIKELFEREGVLVSHAVHYDRSGRSTGSAEAVFRNRENAEAAQRKYNGVQLDGKAMLIDLIEKGDPPSDGRTLKSGIRISAPGPSSKAVASNRALSQAVAHATQAPRGRGAMRSSAVAMDM